MTWYDEMLAWLRVPEPAEEAIEGRLIDLGLQGRTSWVQVQRGIRALHSGRFADLVVLLFGAIFTEAQLETLPSALATGADPWELLLLGVHGRNCEGEDLPLLSPVELRGRLQTAARLGQESPSAWLGGYTLLLLEEQRRRSHGDARRRA